MPPTLTHHALGDVRDGVLVSSCTDWHCMLGLRGVGGVGGVGDVGMLSMVMWEASPPREMICLASGVLGMHD